MNEMKTMKWQLITWSNRHLLSLTCERPVCVCVCVCDACILDTGNLCAIEASHSVHAHMIVGICLCSRRSCQSLDGPVYCVSVCVMRERISFYFSRSSAHKFPCSCVLYCLMVARRHDQTLDFNSLAVNKHWFLCRGPVVHE